MTLSEQACVYLGVKQGSERHKAIVRYYNNYLGYLPRSYPLKISDAWCAAFVSVVMHKAGNVVNPPYECSCRLMLQKFKDTARVVANPKINDIVFYDWGNNGTIDHVGVVLDVNINKKTMRVVEGNYNRQVGIRFVSYKNNEIEAFCRVKQK